MKKFAALLLVLACKGTEPIEPQPELAAGTYSLVSVNGKGLPIYVGPFPDDSLRSSVLTVHADQTFTEDRISGPVVGQAKGTIVFRQDGFRFWANGDSTQTMFSAVSLSGSTLTATFYGQTRVFTKQP